MYVSRTLCFNSFVMTATRSSPGLLYLVSFFEGGALMAVELLGAKLIAPYYGTSLYVWAAVLACTLGGLALGYLLGGILSNKYKDAGALYFIVALSALFTFLLPLTGKFIMEATLGMSLKTGITLSAFIMLTPPVFLFGTVSPLIINLLSASVSRVGKAAGTVYAVSTVGGICATFLTGFYLAPFVGIKETSWLVAGTLAIWPLLFVCIRFVKK
jgi:hypothetical protein